MLLFILLVGIYYVRFIIRTCTISRLTGGNCGTYYNLIPYERGWCQIWRGQSTAMNTPSDRGDHDTTWNSSGLDHCPSSGRAVACASTREDPMKAVPLSFISAAVHVDMHPSARQNCLGGIVGTWFPGRTVLTSRVMSPFSSRPVAWTDLRIAEQGMLAHNWTPQIPWWTENGPRQNGIGVRGTQGRGKRCLPRCSGYQVSL